MFGITVEKLILVGLVAAFILGPQRIPQYAAALGRFVRDLLAFIDTARAAAQRETEAILPVAGLEDLRRYDPRAIVRDALQGEPPASAVAAQAGQTDAADAAAEPGSAAPGSSAPASALVSPTSPSAPALAAPAAPEPAAAPDPMPSLRRHPSVSGTSGHPRRLLDIGRVPAAPAELPAAELPAAEVEADSLALAER